MRQLGSKFGLACKRQLLRLGITVPKSGLVRWVLTPQCIRVGTDRPVPCSAAYRRGPLGDDRYGHDLHQRDVPGEPARGLPRLDPDDRTIWHSRDRLRCAVLHSYGCVGLEASFRLGLAWHLVPRAGPSAGGIAAMVRESWATSGSGCGTGKDRDVCSQGNRAICHR